MALTPPELRQQAAKARADADALFEQIKKEDRNPTDEEENRYTALESQEAKLIGEAERANRWLLVDQRFNNASPKNQSLGMVSAKDEPAMLPHNDEVNTRKGRHTYSIMKVFRHLLDPRMFPMGGLELEVHAEMEKTRKGFNQRSAYGWNIPLDLPVNTEASRRFARNYGIKLRSPNGTMNEERALDTTAGAGSIPTIVDTTIIELLRARMVTRMMAREL